MSASLHLPNGPTIRVDIEGTSAAVIAAASTLPTATLHEAGGRIGTGGIEGSRIHSDLFHTICWFSTPLREARLALYSFSVGESESSLHSNRTRTIWLEQLPIEPA